MNKYYPSQDPIKKLEEKMKLRGFSLKTKKTYLGYIKKALEHANKNPKTMNTGDVRN